MNSALLLDSINLKVELIPSDRPNRPGTLIQPTYITIHNTDNSSKGADANAHSKFVRYTGYYESNEKKHYISWHYTVDDRVAIRQLPDTEKAWHAGTETGNASSIAIEICMQQGIDQAAANQRAAELTAFLLNEHRLPITAVVPHQHWSGKHCPSLLLGEEWPIFIAMVEHLLTALTGEVDTLELPAAFEFKPDMCWHKEN